jgi:hypothetical protein
VSFVVGGIPTGHNYRQLEGLVIAIATMQAIVRREAERTRDRLEAADHMLSIGDWEAFLNETFPGRDGKAGDYQELAEAATISVTLPGTPGRVEEMRDRARRHVRIFDDCDQPGVPAGLTPVFTSLASGYLDYQGVATVSEADAEMQARAAALEESPWSSLFGAAPCAERLADWRRRHWIR